MDPLPARLIDHDRRVAVRAEHPAGVVVAVPRTDLLVFAPASDTAAVDGSAGPAPDHPPTGADPAQTSR